MKLTHLLPLLPFLSAVSAKQAPTNVDTQLSPSPSPTPAPQSCGGFTTTPHACPKGQVCIDDPRSGGCGMACDMPGICVNDRPCEVQNGERVCPKGQICVDDPRFDTVKGRIRDYALPPRPRQLISTAAALGSLHPLVPKAKCAPKIRGLVPPTRLAYV